MKVVIAEKPSVARDLARVLGATSKKEGYFEGKDYFVTWAFGHLIRLTDPDGYDPRYKKWRFDDLPIIPESFKKELGADKGIKKQFKIIKSLLQKKDVDEAICATDAGREGELIFRFIYEMAGCKKPIQRLWVSSQTDQALNEGFEHLKSGKDYDPLYDSALCRSEADWLVGMNATRAYTIVCSKGSGVMSVGRVQTPVLKLIVDRYDEHINFKPETFWEIIAYIRHQDGLYSGKWFKKSETRLFDKDKAESILNEVKEHPDGIISDVTRKQKKEKQPLLYDLTELQKEANRRFKFSADRTLKVAQSLYERHKLLTYPRTNSRYLSSDMVPKLQGLIKNVDHIPDYEPFSKELLSKKLAVTNRIVDDKKVTDHFAIIPTDKKADLSQLSPEEKKIYDMVIRRFLCVFYDVCVKDQTDIISEFGKQTFKTTGIVIVKPGWRALYIKEETDNSDVIDDEDTSKTLPDVKKSDPITQKKCDMVEKQTKPPALYTEASILAAMETAGKNIEDEELREAMKDCGLGTPATRAQILERLLEVKYIERDKQKLVPTYKGIQIISAIQDPALLSPELTGEMEKKLNDIAHKRYSRKEYMDTIKAFTEQLVENLSSSKMTHSGPQAVRTKKLIGECPLCGGSVVETAKAFSCDNWRENGCKFVIWKSIASKQITESIAKKLIETGKSGFIKGFKSKSGKTFDTELVVNEEGKVVFDFTNPREENIIGKCPLCDGNIVENSRAFSCSNWKEKNCKFVIWKRIAGKDITEDYAKELLENSKTQPIKGFRSKSGKIFEAVLKLKDGKVEFDF
ncbi:DNA topoisomerase 3 [Thermoproteota archaeon]